ncbi:MAG: S26 family signal peptidase [Mesorhizobium sp.]|nr:MAG: S26 family signal peptidase [Mesorhizobium sp.]
MRARCVEHLFQRHLVVEHRLENIGLLFLDLLLWKISSLETEILLPLPAGVVVFVNGPEFFDENEDASFLKVLRDKLDLLCSVRRVHKHILAISGQTVCRNNLNVSVDGTEVGTALVRDRSGRDLPSWQGCQRIPPGAVFLMNRQVRDSLDGRYFGFVTTDHIIGRAVPLWTDEQSDGRFQWRSPRR